MNANTVVYYQGKKGTSFFSNQNGDWQFATKEQLIDAINSFKNNPRSHNSEMSDENVLHWQNQKYSIQKVTVVTETGEVI